MVFNWMDERNKTGSKLRIGVVMCSFRDEAIKYAKEKYGKKYNLAEYHIEVMNCIKDYEKGLQRMTKLINKHKK